MKYLYPYQREVAATIIENLKTHGFAMLKAGAKSGKSTIVGKIVEHSPQYERFSLFAENYRKGNDQQALWLRKHLVQVNSWPDPELGPKALILIDEAFNLKDSFAIYLLAKHRGHHILAYGANGPEYAIPNEWQTLGKVRPAYNSWDLNPEFCVDLGKDFDTDDDISAEADAVYKYGKF